MTQEEDDEIDNFDEDEDDNLGCLVCRRRCRGDYCVECDEDGSAFFHQINTKKDRRKDANFKS